MREVCRKYCNSVTRFLAWSCVMAIGLILFSPHASGPADHPRPETLLAALRADAARQLDNSRAVSGQYEIRGDIDLERLVLDEVDRR